MDSRSSYDRHAEETTMKTDLIIFIFNDGSRQQVEITPVSHPRKWSDRMVDVGNEVKSKVSGLKAVGTVYISGQFNEVSNYTANETAEIFGLEV